MSETSHEQEETIHLEQDHIEVWKWSSVHRAEDKWIESYVPTPEYHRLKHALTSSQNQLVGVIGLQGVGKTSLFQKLWQELPKAEGFSWRGMNALLANNYDESTESWYDAVQKSSRNILIDEVYGKDFLVFLEKRDREAVWALRRRRKDRESYELNKSKIVAAAEQYATKTLIRKCIREAVYGLLGNSHNILIDLPDYGKQHRSQMNKDLNEIRDIWSALRNLTHETNFIIFIQKEMFENVRHFLYGKMDIIELKPYTPEFLLDAYRSEFGGSAPFTDEALHELAAVSDGIFRRFQRYIKDCYEEAYWVKQQDTLIDIELVQETIGLRRRAADMELELLDVFPRSKELRFKVAQLQSYLRKLGGSGEQGDITTELFGNDSVKASRFLSTLEASGYVSRDYDGKRKVITWRR